MQKLFIDMASAQPAPLAAVNGGGEYATKMLAYIAERHPDCAITISLDKNKGENRRISALAKRYHMEIKEFASNEELSALIAAAHPDLLFLPVAYPSYFSLKIDSNLKVLETIHDMSNVCTDQWIDVPERYTTAKNYRVLRYLKYHVFRRRLHKKHIEDHQKVASFARNGAILTVSEYTKGSLNYYACTGGGGIPISVLYPALFESADTQNSSLDLSALGLENKRYYLMVSGSRWHKNNYFAMKAIDAEISRNAVPAFRQYKYVVSGVEERFKQFYLRHIRNPQYFVFLDFLPKADYNFLLKNARSFLYPSLWEGFGVPPIEAMGLGVPALCSSSTCIPEVCGDAAIYFAPRNQESFTLAMMQSFDDAFLEEKIALGKARYSYVKNRADEDLEKFDAILTELLSCGSDSLP